ncbi:MAG: hypothetical protein ACRD10_12625 [Terriglobia bacterium]
MTGFGEQEVVHLFWDDIDFTLNTVRLTAKPDLGFFAQEVGRTRDAHTPAAHSAVESSSCEEE